MKTVRTFVKKLPILRDVVNELQSLRAQNADLRFQVQQLAPTDSNGDKEQSKIYKPDANDLNLEFFDRRWIPGGKHKDKA